MSREKWREVWNDLVRVRTFKGTHVHTEFVERRKFPRECKHCGSERGKVSVLEEKEVCVDCGK